MKWSRYLDSLEFFDIGRKVMNWVPWLTGIRFMRDIPTTVQWEGELSLLTRWNFLVNDPWQWLQVTHEGSGILRWILSEITLKVTRSMNGFFTNFLSEKMTQSHPGIEWYFTLDFECNWHPKLPIIWVIFFANLEVRKWLKDDQDTSSFCSWDFLIQREMKWPRYLNSLEFFWQVWKRGLISTSSSLDLISSEESH